MKHVREQAARHPRTAPGTLGRDGRGRRTGDGERPVAALSGRGVVRGGARGRAGDRGVAHRAGQRRGDERPQDAARRSSVGACRCGCATRAGGSPDRGARADRGGARVPAGDPHARRSGAGRPRRGRCTVVPLADNAATAYNPFGTEPENPRPRREPRRRRPDRRAGAAREYYEGNLRHPSGGTGLRGLPRRCAGRSTRRRCRCSPRRPGSAPTSTSPTTSTCRSPDGNSTPLTQRGWIGPVGSDKNVAATRASASTSRATIPLLPAVDHRAGAGRAPGDDVRTAAAALVGDRGCGARGAPAPARRARARARGYSTPPAPTSFA